MPPDNTGSFGAATGGADALKAAMQRRGVDTSRLDQMSPAVGGTPVAPNIPQTNPQIGSVGAPSAPGGPVAPEGATSPAQTFRSAENEIALKALVDVVKTENKIALSALQLQGLT